MNASLHGNSRPAGVALAALAAAFGLTAARLPLPAAITVTLGPSLLALIVVEPLAGLGLTLLAAPLKAWLKAAYPGLALDPGQIVFGLTLAAWLARGAARREIQIPRLPSALFLSLSLFLLIAAYSLWSAASLADGVGELIKWAEVGLMAALVYDAAGRRRLPWIIAAVLAAGAFQAAIGLWQFAFSTAGPGSFAILADRYRAYGTFEQPNPFGGFMGLLWPVAAGLALGSVSSVMHQIARSVRHASRFTFRVSRFKDCVLRSLPFVLVLLSLSLFLAALVVSFSRGAWLGAGAAGLTLVAFVPRRRWLGLALVAAGLFGGSWLAGRGLLPSSITTRLAGLGEITQVYDVRGVGMTSENYAVIERLAFWQTAVAMAGAHPWLGVGLGNYPAAYPAYALLNWPLPIGHAHNIYLNMLAEVGALGLAAYLLFWAGIAALTLRALRVNDGWRRGLALGLLAAWSHLTVHHLVDNLYVNNLHLFVGAYLGVLAAIVNTDDLAGSRCLRREAAQ